MPRSYRDVMSDLVDAVVDGSYPEGTWLPRERELAERFGCSRGVAREALRGLEERGLIAVHPARGQRVRHREYWDVRDPDVLHACIARGPDRTTLAQAIDARAAVESEAARRAIQHATEADLRLLGGHIGEMEAAGAEPARRSPDRDDRFVIADAWFHHTLALLSDNTVLARLVEPLHIVLAEHRHLHAAHRERAVVRHHRRILEGVSAREPELAAEAIESYARALTRWLGGARE